VLDADGAPIPGLYAAGELVGGIFWFNYPGGSGPPTDRCSAGSPEGMPPARARAAALSRYGLICPRTSPPLWRAVCTFT
jgi:tricarballylate dehydrogenase